jgi:N-acetyl-anhydromuramyl-L-alanine amidase AmpD
MRKLSNGLEYKEKDTPNISIRKSRPSVVVLHHTGGLGLGNVAWLCSPHSKVSADWYISRAGSIWKLNPQIATYYTWHCGVSKFLTYKDVNPVSIGIELEHVPGQDWPESQIKACHLVCEFMMTRFSKITIDRIVGHKDIALPVGRKNDPEGFPWVLFRKLFTGGD